MMILSIGLVLLGFLLLVLGGEVLLRGAVGLATVLRVTPAVVGLTVVAAGTSVPELAVSVLATARGSPDIAVGNAVGSNIFNIAFILGLAALVRPLAITGSTVRLEYPVTVLVTLLAVAVCADGTVSRLDAVLFLAVYVGFTAYLVRLVRGQMSRQEEREFAGEVAELAPPPRDGRSAGLFLALVAAGVVLLGVGAHLIVTGAVDLARLLGVSERVIGLTVVAVGTGLPEMVTSLVSSYRGRDDVAVGNVLGSNLFNLLVILGLNGLVAPLPIAAGITASDNWWMLGLTVGLGPLLLTAGRILRSEGALLLAAYGLYMAVLLAR